MTASGLNVLPTKLPSYQLNQPISAVTALTEAVWNQYVINNGQMGLQDYTNNYSGSGGVDVTQPIPQYQIKFGLSRSMSPTAIPAVACRMCRRSAAAACSIMCCII